MDDLRVLKLRNARARSLFKRPVNQPYVAWPGDTVEVVEAAGGLPDLGDWKPKGWAPGRMMEVENNRAGFEFVVANMRPGRGYASVDWTDDGYVVVREYKPLNIEEWRKQYEQDWSIYQPHQVH